MYELIFSSYDSLTMYFFYMGTWFQDSSTEMESLCQLASLAVVGLKASGSSRDNGVVEVELCMDNFTLDDERPGTIVIHQ